MKVKLVKRFRFEASHSLEHLPEEHRCRQLHGHSYKLDVEVYGEVDPATGFLIDYGDIKKIVQKVIDQLDHKHLNDVEELEYATAECLVKWLWDRIKPALPSLSKIAIHETESTSCEYTG